MSLESQIKSQSFRSQRHKAIINLMFTAYQLKSRISLMLKEYALTPEQYNVLRILKGSHPTPLCVKDIAGRMIERNSNVPRIADRLVAKKLVKRSPSPADRRETLLQLTAAGINLLEASSLALAQEEDSIINITEIDAANLNSLLEGLLPE